MLQPAKAHLGKGYVIYSNHTASNKSYATAAYAIVTYTVFVQELANLDPQLYKSCIDLPFREDRSRKLIICLATTTPHNTVYVYMYRLDSQQACRGFCIIVLHYYQYCYCDLRVHG